MGAQSGCLIFSLPKINLSKMYYLESHNSTNLRYIDVNFIWNSENPQKYHVNYHETLPVFPPHTQDKQTNSNRGIINI